ncbi:MobC [Serratia marcescens]|uniref:MobC n=1 Tax=Serratia marcescens TaxID=615 RepID=UPI001A2CE549|nr:MobC [Serratia marcescens]HAU5732269.1 MobC [Serratia marcescens]HAU5752365.1 MobC [Serratia marcescens]
MADFDIIGRAYACKKKAFYSSEDIGKFKSILDDLPDVTSERLEKKHVLDELKSDIKKLKDSKGYEDKEILKFLNDAGFSDVTLRDIKDITAGRVGKKRTSNSRKKITGVDEDQRTQNGSTGQNSDASGPQY